MSDSSILFTTETPILISLLGTETFGLGLYWKPWKLRHCDIYSDGRFVVRKEDTVSSSLVPPIKVLDVKQVTISSIALDHVVIETSNPLIKKEIGFHIKCKKLHGIDTYFRCILNEEFVESFLVALQNLNPSQSLSLKTILSSQNNDHHQQYTKSSIYPSYPAIHDKPTVVLVIKRKLLSIGSNRMFVSTQSVMRRAITHAMDNYIIQSRQERIKSRRGAFRWLPVKFSNDLSHGSWWFTIGSLVFVIAASITLDNSFNEMIGDDDSVLSRYHYRATWVLLVISGSFFTLGSLAFIRAFHDEPPMKPLFSWYHLQSDELLASWLFFFGALPAVPYCLIYISEEDDKEFFLGGLVVALFLVLGSFLFVWASYPSDKSRRQYCYYIAKYLCCCCCGEQALRKYFANDWLAGTWIVYYGTFIATFISFGLLLSGIARGRDLSMFINGTTLIENICFLIGSAYFVAGSFPDDALLPLEENHHHGHHNDGDDQQADYILVSEHGTKLQPHSEL